jgi:hypothetical protein
MPTSIRNPENLDRVVECQYDMERSFKAVVDQAKAWGCDGAKVYAELFDFADEHALASCACEEPSSLAKRYSPCELALKGAFFDFLIRAIKCGWTQVEGCFALMDLADDYFIGRPAAARAYEQLRRGGH